MAEPGAEGQVLSWMLLCLFLGIAGWFYRWFFKTTLWRALRRAAARLAGKYRRTLAPNGQILFEPLKGTPPKDEDEDLEAMRKEIVVLHGMFVLLAAGLVYTAAAPVLLLMKPWGILPGLLIYAIGFLYFLVKSEEWVIAWTMSRLHFPEYFIMHLYYTRRENWTLVILALIAFAVPGVTLATGELTPFGQAGFVLFYSLAMALFRAFLESGRYGRRRAEGEEEDREE